MRTKYIRDLEKVKEMEENLSELVLLAYDKFELYLKNDNKNELEEIINLNYDVNRKGSEIEKFCYDLLALQQPVAKDLRFLQMSIKLASTYKRISSHISQAAIILLEFGLRDKEKEFVKAFIDKQKIMTKNGSESFSKNDNELALKTIEDDGFNNDLFEKCIRYLVELTKSDSIEPMELSEKVLFYKYFERLGDRLAKVADYATRL